MQQQRVSTGTVDSALKKRHTLLTFGFTGTGYFGLQSQTAEGDPERPTVTDVLRRALLRSGAIVESNFSPLQRTKWALASRTDKGVHAACAAASFKMETLESETELLDGHADERWQLTESGIARINAELPEHIRVFSAGKVRKSFDARCAPADANTLPLASS